MEQLIPQKPFFHCFKPWYFPFYASAVCFFWFCRTELGLNSIQQMEFLVFITTYHFANQAAGVLEIQMHFVPPRHTSIVLPSFLHNMKIT